VESAESEEEVFLINFEKDLEDTNIFEVESEEEVEIPEKNDLDLAKESINRGERKEAEDYLREYIKDNDEDLEAKELLGNLYYNEGLWEEALGIFQKAQEISQTNMGIIYMIAKCYDAMSKLDEAEKLVDELLSKKPDDFELMLFLGELFFEGNKNEDAKRMFNKCYKQEPRNLKLLINFAKLYDREGLVKEAISYLNDAKRISPDSPLVRFNLGEMLLKSRHYEEAVDEFKKVLEIDVDKTICYRYIGICYKELSRPDLAIASFKSAVDANPLDGELFVEMAEIYIKNGEYDNAGECLDRALQIKKDDLKALYLKGIVSAKKGIILEAIRKWEEVLAIAPESELAEEAKKSILVAQNWTEILGKKIK